MIKEIVFINIFSNLQQIDYGQSPALVDCAQCEAFENNGAAREQGKNKGDLRKKWFLIYLNSVPFWRKINGRPLTLGQSVQPHPNLHQNSRLDNLHQRCSSNSHILNLHKKIACKMHQKCSPCSELNTVTPWICTKILTCLICTQIVALRGK